ncbi:MAG: UvrD-helicase domain-containing protein [Polyangiaceae bacterium]|nr:UvrD-helicase domain-containing protein [Polyangiaceae bacterium]
MSAQSEVLLNDPQKQAVLHGHGPLIIFAGAGSGKTRTLIYRIANLLSTHRVPPYRILAVTFTNKAAGEMRARLDSLAGPEITRDLWIGTFHSVCAKLLRRYADQVGLTRDYVIYDDSDQKAVLTRILKRRSLDDKEYPPKVVLGKIGHEKREGRRARHAQDLAESDNTLAELYADYERALLQANAVDFEDLILYMTELVENTANPVAQELRSRFDFVLVDEFQDTNMIQYRLIRALSERTRNVCVVGDDDQSIYGWRGADVRLIRGFRRDFPDAEVIKLEQNYRSSANIVRAAMGVIAPAHQREEKNLWTAEPPGNKVIVRALGDEREEARSVADSIRRATEHGTDPADIAIFYRVHAQSRVIEDMLRGYNIPYQIIGGMKFFERAEVKDLLSYLRLIENPRSDTDLLRIINVPVRGIGNKTVERVLDLAGENSVSVYEALRLSAKDDVLARGAKKKLAEFYELLEDFRADAQKLLPHELANAILDRTGYRSSLQAQDSAEADARLGNMEELVGSLAEYEKEVEQNGEPPTLSGYLERISLVAAVDNLQAGSQVSLMTVHSAKGLEFDTVFVTGLEEEVFPYRGVDGENSEELDEERRLAYVALTRARRNLILSHVSARMLFGRTRYLVKSRFLADIPSDVVEHHGTGHSSFRPNYGSPYAGDRGGSYDHYERPSLPTRTPLMPGERIIERDVDDIPGDDTGEPVHPGDRVFHKHFGRGIVRRVELGSQPFITAEFPKVGTKRVAAQYLERV